MAIKDISNTTFGDIKVIDFAYTKNKRAYWNCLCSCGKQFIAIGKEIRSGKIKHCGCKKKENLSKTLLTKYNLAGKRFGRLIVLEQIPKYKGKDTYYRCKCDCGNEKMVKGKSLSDGATSSCGCYRRECHQKDITGQKFNRLTAIRPVGTNKAQSVLWECQCDCGNIVTAPCSSIVYGNTKSCGCLLGDVIRDRYDNLEGKKFNRLLVVKFAYSKGKSRYWECMCDCGNTTYVKSYLLTSGGIKSCGCLNHEPSCIIHGLAKKTPLYFVWKELRHRCYNPKHKSYKNYGARGIRVCDEWKNDFKAFYDWAIKNGYKEEKLPNGKNKWTIDRINVNGNYCPENCRFITNAEQMKNKQNTVYVDYQGEKISLFDLADKFNLKQSILYNRLFVYHRCIERAVNTLPKEILNISYKNRNYTINSLSRELGFCHETLRNLIKKKGYGVEDAVNHCMLLKEKKNGATIL